MAGTGDQDYQRGYEQGSATCLTNCVEAAYWWLAQHQTRPSQRRFGFANAVWDYEDANGLPHIIDLETSRCRADH